MCKATKEEELREDDSTGNEIIEFMIVNLFLYIICLISNEVFTLKPLSLYIYTYISSHFSYSSVVFSRQGL